MLSPAAEPTARERRRRRTHSMIQQEALRLMAEQGYEATTCEQIAAAADVSPATFFRYFRTKEDVVLGDEYDPMLVELLRARPARERPLTAMRRALAEGLAAVYDRDAGAIRARSALIMSVPALRAKLYEQSKQTEAIFAEVLAPRMGRPADDIAVRAVAAAGTAAMVVAVERWTDTGGTLAEHLEAALGALDLL